MSVTTALTVSSTRAYLRDKSSLAFLVLFGAIYADEILGEQPYIQYVASGVLSWGVANAAVFGTAFTLMQWRRDDLLRLIRLTPARLPSVLVARLLVTTGIAASQVVLFIAVAMLPQFGLRPASTWPLLVPVLLAGVAAFLAVGGLVGSLTDTPESAAAVSNLLMVPMAFLSGAFIPLESMPQIVQRTSTVLPLRYLTDGARAALSGEDAVRTALTSIAVLAGFTLVGSVLLLRVFRWSMRT
jgi:ABC-2 type transport system permease protein